MAQARTLTPEFKKKFVMKIGGAKGKDAILYNGLLALAHEHSDYGHIRSFITQYPAADNKFTAFARAEIYNKKGEIVGMEEADASAANCGKMTAASFPRMALTRAKGRAFRDFLNVDMVTMEEVNVFEPELASPELIGKIKRAAKDMRLPKDDLYDLMYDVTGAEEFNELTEGDAQEVLEALAQEKEEREAKPARKKKRPPADEDDEDDMDFSDDDDDEDEDE